MLKILVVNTQYLPTCYKIIWPIIILCLHKTETKNINIMQHKRKFYCSLLYSQYICSPSVTGSLSDLFQEADHELNNQSFKN